MSNSSNSPSAENNDVLSPVLSPVLKQVKQKGYCFDVTAQEVHQEHSVLCKQLLPRLVRLCVETGGKHEGLQKGLVHSLSKAKARSAKTRPWQLVRGIVREMMMGKSKCDV